MDLILAFANGTRSCIRGWKTDEVYGRLAKHCLSFTCLWHKSSPWRTARESGPADNHINREPHRPQSVARKPVQYLCSRPVFGDSSYVASRSACKLPLLFSNRTPSLATMLDLGASTSTHWLQGLAGPKTGLTAHLLSHAASLPCSNSNRLHQHGLSKLWEPMARRKWILAATGKLRILRRCSS